MAGKIQAPLLDRLIDKIVIEPSGCWRWTGAISKGYGIIAAPGRTGLLKAHRVTYEWIVGPIPDGLQIDHLCRNRACVNPAHMEPVTQAENIRRGLSPTAENARKTTCPEGHEYDIHTDGRRCSRCRRAWTLAYRREYQKRPEVHEKRIAAQRARRARSRT